VFGFRDEATDGGFDGVDPERSEFLTRLAAHPFGERGAAGDRGRAAAHLVANLGDPAVFKARGQPQDVAASGIRDFDRDRGRREFTHVARIFEMIEEGFAVQEARSHSNYATGDSLVTIVVAAVIEGDGLVLIGQRKRTGQHPLRWEFPGGKAEPGETPEAALARELNEELAIQARIDSEIMRYDYQYPGRPPILLIFYRVADFDGAPQNLDFEQLVWAPRERLRDYDFLEGDAEFIRKYFGSATGPGKA
jgi:mutator protein MutT